MILGTPNVGKSTLFNRLVGRRAAITDATPGVTRDRQEAAGELAGLSFSIVDTAGLDDVQTFLYSAPSPSQLVNRQPPSPDLQRAILRQTQLALSGADIALFLIDARQPLSQRDLEYARLVRRQHWRWSVGQDGRQERRQLPVLLVANKVEDGTDRERLPGLDEAMRLGLGQPVELSAEHGQGMAALHNAIQRCAQELAESKRQAQEELAKSDAEADAAVAGQQRERLHFAIVGKPNTGKSTLLNALLGEERVVTGPQPGITRDSISCPLPASSHPQYAFSVVDTAGIRGGQITRAAFSRVDAAAMTDSLRAIDLCSVVVLVIDVSDATQLAGVGDVKARKLNADDEAALLLSRVHGVVHQQDLAIARRVTDEGRALVIALNKMDLVAKGDRASLVRGLRLVFDQSLPQVKQVPLIPLSALSSLHLPTLLPAIAHTFERWNRHIPTHRLTPWLMSLQRFRPHPAYKGRRVVLRYLLQTGTRPPSFVAWLRGGGAGIGLDCLSDDWLRMMRGMLSTEFGLDGVIIRLRVKRGLQRDREERRREARSRQAEQLEEEEREQRTRPASLEVKDGEEEEDAGLDAEDEEGQLWMDREEAKRARAMQAGSAEEQQEEDDDDSEEAMEDDDDDVETELTEEAETRDRLQSARRPPGESRQLQLQESVRHVAVDTAINQQPVPGPSTVSSLFASFPSRPAPPREVSGFMSPPPLVAPPSSAVSRPRRPASTGLSFLPLPPPPRPSSSLTWTQRREAQQVKQRRRSEAIAAKKQQAQFVSLAAWAKWKKVEEERQQAWVRREAKVRRGREKAAGKGLDPVQAEGDEWREGRGERGHRGELLQAEGRGSRQSGRRRSRQTSA